MRAWALVCDWTQLLTTLCFLYTVAKTTDELRKDNQVATLKKLKAVITTEMNQVRLDFEAYCKTHMPVDDTKQLDSKFNILKEIGRKVGQTSCSQLSSLLPRAD